MSVGAGEPEPTGTRRHAQGRCAGSVNVWLVFHLAAIIIAPAAVGPSSELVHAAWDCFQPYLELLYLNHGYHFFAPEPEESTLLSYEAERPDGTVVRGRIPDPAIGPRLLYHRYFMLTEHMRNAPDELRDLWHRSYAEQIGRQYGARRVEPDPADSPPADPGADPGGRAPVRPGELRGPSAGRLSMRRLISPAVDYVVDLARSFARAWNAVLVHPGRSHAARARCGS